MFVEDEGAIILIREHPLKSFCPLQDRDQSQPLSSRSVGLEEDAKHFEMKYIMCDICSLNAQKCEGGRGFVNVTYW